MILPSHIWAFALLGPKLIKILALHAILED